MLNTLWGHSVGSSDILWRAFSPIKINVNPKKKTWMILLLPVGKTCGKRCGKLLEVPSEVLYKVPL